MIASPATWSHNELYMSHQLEFMTGNGCILGRRTLGSSGLFFNLNGFMASERQYEEVLHQLQWESVSKALLTIIYRVYASRNMVCWGTAVMFCYSICAVYFVMDDGLGQVLPPDLPSPLITHTSMLNTTSESKIILLGCFMCRSGMYFRSLTRAVTLICFDSLCKRVCHHLTRYVNLQISRSISNFICNCCDGHYPSCSLKYSFNLIWNTYIK